MKSMKSSKSKRVRVGTKAGVVSGVDAVPEVFRSEKPAAPSALEGSTESKKGIKVKSTKSKKSSKLKGERVGKRAGVVSGVKAVPEVFRTEEPAAHSALDERTEGEIRVPAPDTGTATTNPPLRSTATSSTPGAFRVAGINPERSFQEEKTAEPEDESPEEVMVSATLVTERDRGDEEVYEATELKDEKISWSTFMFRDRRGQAFLIAFLLVAGLAIGLGVWGTNTTTMPSSTEEPTGSPTVELTGSPTVTMSPTFAKTAVTSAQYQMDLSLSKLQKFSFLNVWRFNDTIARLSLDYGPGKGLDDKNYGDDDILKVKTTCKLRDQSVVLASSADGRRLRRPEGELSSRSLQSEGKLRLNFVMEWTSRRFLVSEMNQYVDALPSYVNNDLSKFREKLVASGLQTVVDIDPLVLMPSPVPTPTMSPGHKFGPTAEPTVLATTEPTFSIIRDAKTFRTEFQQDIAVSVQREFRELERFIFQNLIWSYTPEYAEKGLFNKVSCVINDQTIQHIPSIRDRRASRLQNVTSRGLERTLLRLDYTMIWKWSTEDDLTFIANDYDEFINKRRLPNLAADMRKAGLQTVIDAGVAIKGKSSGP